VKAWLSREGVPFTAYNVDEDDRAYDDLIARGFRTVPVTVFGERTATVVKGFDEPALTAAIAEWRAKPAG
jgi:hypothetical protein